MVKQNMAVSFGSSRLLMAGCSPGLPLPSRSSAAFCRRAVQKQPGSQEMRPRFAPLSSEPWAFSQPQPRYPTPVPSRAPPSHGSVSSHWQHPLFAWCGSAERFHHRMA